jgi:hypothetical protein
VPSDVKIVLALPQPPSAVPAATHVRGMVIVSSQRSLQQRGHEAAYRRAIDEEFQEALMLVVAPSWLPIEVGLAHYRACESLKLDAATVHEIGLESGRFLYSSTVKTVIRMSTQLGTSPWMAIKNIDRLSARTWDGGAAFAVRELGPKEAELAWFGQPCARVPYFQHAFGGFMRGCIEPLCRTSFARLIRRPGDENSIGYRISWV